MSATAKPKTKVAAPTTAAKTDITPAKLEEMVAEILTTTPNQRAIDIVVSLDKDYGIAVERSIVNKILYGSRFESVSKQGAAPLWRVRGEPEETPAGPTPTISTAAVKLWVAPEAECADKILRAVLECLAEAGESNVSYDLSTASGQLAKKIAADSGLE
jgi:hypothetical protein